MAFFMLKPEATPFLETIREYLLVEHEKQEPLLRMVLEQILSILDIIQSTSLHHLPVATGVDYVESGVMDPLLFGTLYPNAAVPDEHIRRHMKRHYLGNRYYIGFFRIPTALGDSSPFIFLRALKGLMSWEDPANATGLRGHLLRHMLTTTPEYAHGRTKWRDTGNLVHFPDDSLDAMRVREVVTAPERHVTHREVLYHYGCRRIAFWDLYHIVDQQLFLNSGRTSTEVDVISGILQDHRCRSVIDLGCGDGRISAGLAGRGYRVLGIDLDGKALARALRRQTVASGAGSPSYVVWPMHKVRGALQRKYDAAVVMYAVFALTREDQLAAHFRSAYASLRPGGVLVVDTLVRPSSDRAPQTRTLSDSYDFSPRGIAWLRRTRHWNPQTHRENTVFDVETFLGERLQYQFEHLIPSRRTLTAALRSVGFAIVRDPRGGATSLELMHHRCMVIASKPGVPNRRLTMLSSSFLGRGGR